MTDINYAQFKRLSVGHPQRSSDHRPVTRPSDRRGLNETACAQAGSLWRINWQEAAAARSPCLAEVLGHAIPAPQNVSSVSFACIDPSGSDFVCAIVRQIREGAHSLPRPPETRMMRPAGDDRSGDLPGGRRVRPAAPRPAGGDPARRKAASCLPSTTRICSRLEIFCLL
jgi:hypothetical protein